jgi:hypothetical protein
MRVGFEMNRRVAEEAEEAREGEKVFSWCLCFRGVEEHVSFALNILSCGMGVSPVYIFGRARCPPHKR